MQQDFATVGTGLLEACKHAEEKERTREKEKERRNVPKIGIHRSMRLGKDMLYRFSPRNLQANMTFFTFLPSLTIGSTCELRSAWPRRSLAAASARSGWTPMSRAKSQTPTPARPSESWSPMASSSESPSPCTREAVPAS